MTIAVRLIDETKVSCERCHACCCSLEVLLISETGVPESFIDTDAWGGDVMLRLDDGFCAALDRDTYLCTIYEKRPWVCREFASGSDDCIEQRLSYGLR
jgi:Fe-S-cluster containining protein